MKILATLITITALGLSLSASAADKKKEMPKVAEKHWEKEPNSFLGISFSSSIESIPPCPYTDKGLDFAEIEESGKVCAGRENYSRERADLAGGPNTGFPYDVTARGWEQGIAYFYLKTEPEHFLELVDVFMKRYGEPTNLETETIQTRGGAEFSNQTLYWSGKNVSIILQRYNGDINTTTAIVSSRAYDKAQAEKRKKKLSEGASQF